MALSLVIFWSLLQPVALAQILEDDETRIRWADGDAVSRFRRNAGPAPVTVAASALEQEIRTLPLDEAIRIALQHSEAIRVLTGTSASFSGQTIYDTAIAATPIDVAKARFDPVFQANTAFLRAERPLLDGTGTAIVGSLRAGSTQNMSISDLNQFGGIAAITADNAWNSDDNEGFLTRNASSLELSYTQPLLAGSGQQANLAPIVIARLQQSQSYFQFKDSIQGLVRDVITGYWLLVQARTELWASKQLVNQLQFATDRVDAQLKTGLVAIQDAALIRTSFMNANARLVRAQGTVLQREGALRNLLGLPPEDGTRIVPTTPPTRDQVEFRWNEIVDTAQAKRPDLIELNLVLMADQHQLLRNRNLARPELNALAIHQWNGLAGRTAAGNFVSTPYDRHTDWTLGVEFSVPLSLRKARADVRNLELLIARDRATIQQSIHQLEHTLATTLRNVDLNLEQYEAFRAARDAAAISVPALEARTLSGGLGRTTVLEVLGAYTDLANAVSAEAIALTSYNTELANLEYETGTILDTHGIRFVEERFASIGPHGQCHEDRCYPLDLRPTANSDRYQDSGKPSEEAFDLQDFSKNQAMPSTNDRNVPPVPPTIRE
jgi:outer membrane protein TolC